jgi:hypothetical protein
MDPEIQDIKVKKRQTPLIILVLPILFYIVYIGVQEPCGNNMWPIPSPALVDFGPYYLVTDQGPLYIGQTYHHHNEGPWVGNMRLLYVDTNGAILLFRYPHGTGSDYSVRTCRGYMPREQITGP